MSRILVGITRERVNGGRSLLSARRQQASYRPLVEGLETRMLLATCVVDRLTDTSQPGTLRSCLLRSGDGDDIVFKVEGTILLTNTLPPLRANLQGPGWDRLTVRRESAVPFRLLTVPAGSAASISGITLENGWEVVGGGIYNDGRLTIADSVLRGHGADRGGGAVFNAGILELIGTTVAANETWVPSIDDQGGGGVYNRGTLTVRGGVFQQNVARLRAYGTSEGGAIYNGGVLSVTDSYFENNEAVGSPFGGSSGGAVAGAGPVTIHTSAFVGNASGAGGAIAKDGKPVVVHDSWFVSNRAGGGGAVSVGARDSLLRGCQFWLNEAANGGAVSQPAMGGNVTIEAGTLAGNRATSSGGAIANLWGQVILKDSTVYGNTARDGGALNVRLGQIQIIQSTISSNAATRAGGAVLVDFNGNVRVSNSTVAFNWAGSSGGGFGLGEPGGVFLELWHTIVAENSAPQAPNVALRLTPRAEGAYNLIGDPSGGSGYHFTDMLGVDPLLGELQDNGGPTWTHLPLPKSPAIDAGNDKPQWPFDQRGKGFQRVSKGGIDIGAVEVQAQDHFFFTVASPPLSTAGGAFDLTLTARDASGQVAADYRGTVRFTSSDGQATLPADYTFTAADAGVHTFNAVILRGAGSHSLTAHDTSWPAMRGSSTVAVNPAMASRLDVIGFPSPVRAGVESAFMVMARDAFDNVVTDYRGTVRFSSTDDWASLPSDYTFTAADAGVRSFPATLRRAGTHTLTATDIASAKLTGSQAGIVVEPAPVAITSIRRSAFTVLVGEPYTLTGTFTGIDVPHTVYVYWGDGKDPTLLPLPAGVHTFAATHQYASRGNYPIFVAVGTDDGSAADAVLLTANEGAVIPPGGLVSWWTGDGSLPVAPDIASSNPGQLRNGTDYGLGLIGQAFRFSGLGQYVEVAPSADLSFAPGRALTIAAWVFMPPALAEGNYTMVDKTQVGDAANYRFLIQKRATGSVLGYWNGSAAIYSTVNVPTNQWAHVAITITSGTLAFYINGAAVGATAQAGLGAANDGPVFLGRDILGRYFNGLLDDVQIYDRRLTVEGIQAIFDAGGAGQVEGVVVEGHGLAPGAPNGPTFDAGAASLLRSPGAVASPRLEAPPTGGAALELEPKPTPALAGPEQRYSARPNGPPDAGRHGTQSAEARGRRGSETVRMLAIWAVYPQCRIPDDHLA